MNAWPSCYSCAAVSWSPPLSAARAAKFTNRTSPLPAQAVEQTGWLYQRFGPDGVAYGMIALTACMALAGAVLTWRATQFLQH